MSLKAQILALLQDGQWHTTLEIETTGFGNSRTMRALRHLRAAGHIIETRRVPQERQDGGLFRNYQEHEYRLVAQPQPPVADVTPAVATANG